MRQVLAALVGVALPRFVVIPRVVAEPVRGVRAATGRGQVAGRAVVRAQVDNQAVAGAKRRVDDFGAGIGVPVRRRRVVLALVFDAGAEADRAVVLGPPVRAAREAQCGGRGDVVQRGPQVAHLRAGDRPIRLVVMPRCRAAGAGLFGQNQVVVKGQRIRAHDAPRQIGRRRFKSERAKHRITPPQKHVVEKTPGLAGLCHAHRLVAGLGLVLVGVGFVLVAALGLVTVSFDLVTAFGFGLVTAVGSVALGFVLAAVDLVALSFRLVDAARIVVAAILQSVRHRAVDALAQRLHPMRIKRAAQADHAVALVRLHRGLRRPPRRRIKARQLNESFLHVHLRNHRRF